MQKILDFLSGKKTYILAVVYVVLAAFNGQALGEGMVPDTGVVIALLASTLRSGISRS